MNPLEILLGVLTAMGGFVEIGELTFAVNAGAKFHYTLLWVVPVGTLGIIVYGEMAGRVAAVAHKPVFDIIRERVGYSLALTTLVASVLVQLLTCTAEIGGIALVLELAVDWPYRALLAIAVVFLLVASWALPFKGIERVFGLLGLFMTVFIASALALRPSWADLASGLVPQLPVHAPGNELELYAYYAVAFLSSIMLPYEVYFYASGAIEDRWKVKDLPINRVTAGVGFTLGAVLGIALVTIGAELFAPRHIEPQLPGTAALGPVFAFGRIGLVLALAGMFFAFAGAAIETTFSSAYSLAQFFGWPWGKFRKPRGAGCFTIAWVALFAIAALVALTGIDPVRVVEYSIVFSVVVLPLTYLPVLVAARDTRLMGRHANGALSNALGVVFFVVLTLAAVAAIPLLIVTHGGEG